MKVLYAAVMMALLAGGAAHAQNPTKDGKEVQTPKTPQEIEAEKAAQRAYQKSLNNIPDQPPTDPWGNVRSDSAPKTAKVTPAKRTKNGTPAN